MFISTPYVSSVHDLTALRNTGVLDVMDPEHVTTGKGYMGSGCDTPYRNSLARSSWRTGRNGLTMASARFVMRWNEPSQI